MRTVQLSKQQARVLSLLLAGKTQAQAARVMRRTPQRISQIVERLRELGELPEEGTS
jgi:DNA-binding CsgD family transcriptional regulator